MQPQIVKFKCISLTPDGKGVISHHGKNYSIPYLIPGEEANCLIQQRKSGVGISLKTIVQTVKTRVKPPCPYFYDCGGCQLQHMSNKAQNQFKMDWVTEWMKPYGKPMPLIAMETPYHYRNKSHHTFKPGKKGAIDVGFYQEKSHELVPVESCMIQDPKADEIVKTIHGMLRSFKLNAYDEDRGSGFLRHVLIKTSQTTGDIMVVLVTGTHLFRGKNNFVKALREKHPEITTILMNVNDKQTSMILGDREDVIYGKGTIRDTLCGLKFEISAKSFYQVNPIQTEKLYNKAIEMAGLTGKESVIDAYSGIGTIGLIASQNADQVIGVEINQDAVRDSIRNCKLNGIKNARFYQADAGEFMVELSSQGHAIDVVFMDPPRTGSDEKFLTSLVQLNPKKIVYISCNPETQARDLKFLVNRGYKVEMIQPVDMFPQTYHVETVVRLQRQNP